MRWVLRLLLLSDGNLLRVGRVFAGTPTYRFQLVELVSAVAASAPFRLLFSAQTMIGRAVVPSYSDQRQNVEKRGESFFSLPGRISGLGKEKEKKKKGKVEEKEKTEKNARRRG